MRDLGRGRFYMDFKDRASRSGVGGGGQGFCSEQLDKSFSETGRVRIGEFRS